MGPDDLYGRWSVCEIKISGIVHPASLIGQFGITKHTVEPFGFKAEYFYEQMQYVGMAHVFNYFFSDDVTLRDHLKSGQRLSVQNRPKEGTGT
jgi:hypothetical protein